MANILLCRELGGALGTTSMCRPSRRRYAGVDAGRQAEALADALEAAYKTSGTARAQRFDDKEKLSARTW
jgi:hypothetical protein